MRNTQILTYTGKLVDPFAMKPDDLDIRDIAHALSLLCRFNGHCKRFYSVGEHSLHVCNLVKVRWNASADTQLAALLHDAQEAYLGDLVRPLKNSGKLDVYKDVEAELIEVLRRRFLSPDTDYELVKHADNVMLATEVKLLMTDSYVCSLPERLDTRVLDSFNLMPSQPSVVEELFLRIYQNGQFE